MTGENEQQQEQQQEVHIVLVSNDPNRAYPCINTCVRSSNHGSKMQVILYNEWIGYCKEKEVHLR